MSINEACHSSQSVSTIPIPSVLLLKPVTNSDLWEYNPQELCEIHAGCDSLAVAQTHPPSGLISRSIHRRRKGTQIKLGVIIATSRSPGNTPLFLDTLNCITRTK